MPSPTSTSVGANVAATDLQPGDQLLAARLVPKDRWSEEVKDKVQISAMLTPERAVGGNLKKGDLVGVYLSFDPFNLDEAGQSTDDGGRRRRRRTRRDDPPTRRTPTSTDTDERRRRRRT